MSRTDHEQAATDLALALRLLVRRIRAAAPSAAHQLSWTQMAVLKRLETEGAATTADLARAEAMKPQSMGTTIAALEALGLIERTPHPTDGRQMRIALTSKGTAIRKRSAGCQADLAGRSDHTARRRRSEEPARRHCIAHPPGGTVSPRLRGTWSHAWRALRHRNFRLFFVGQSISVLGTWMTRLATTWLVYRLTHSALLLGVVTFAGQIVSFALGPFAGVWVERLNRRRLLVWTQAAAAVQSLALAALTLARVITLREIIVLTVLQGLINAFDMPARQSFLVQMVGDQSDLSNAIAINSSMANGARLVGPAIAGMVIGAAGEGWCFLIDGVSYFAVIASLLLMRITRVDGRRHTGGMVEQIREGWDYVRTFRPVRTVLLLFALISLMGYPYAVLLPVFAAQLLHGSAATLGWLTGASGVGALISALSLAVRTSVVGLARMLQIAAADARRRVDALWPVAHAVDLARVDGLRRLRPDAGLRPPVTRSSNHWCRKTNAPAR